MKMMCQEYITLHMRCAICGAYVELKVKAADYEEWIGPNRRYVQDVFPYLTPGEREMFLTRTCDSCCKRMLGLEV